MQLFLFLFPLQHKKRLALQNKQVGVLRMAFRDFRETFTWPEFLENWLALTSIDYHRNVQVSILLNKWLALTMIRATGPWLLANCNPSNYEEVENCSHI